MNDFQRFSVLVHARFEALSKGELFEVGADNRVLEGQYLGAFPEGTDPIYKARTEHDCNCCKQFLRNIGSAVSLVNGEVKTIWDIEGAPYPYDVVAKHLDAYVSSGGTTLRQRANESVAGG
jgi:hypothetical protein